MLQKGQEKTGAWAGEDEAVKNSSTFSTAQNIPPCIAVNFVQVCCYTDQQPDNPLEGKNCIKHLLQPTATVDKLLYTTEGFQFPFL